MEGFRGDNGEVFLREVSMSSAVQRILDRALEAQDLSPEEGLALLLVDEPEAIEAVRATADQLRAIQSGETVSYIINRNVNYTNICEQHCSFCAFRRDAGAEGSYWLEWETIAQKAQEAEKLGATEICMQGGLNPEAKEKGSSLGHYLKLVETVRHAAPSLHIHAFSPQEVEFIARKDGLGFRRVIEALRDAGVGSLPGTAAEVLDDRIRQVICPEKINSALWQEIVETAHNCDLPTTSTMLCGHIETAHQQIHHLDQIRQIQQTAVARGHRGITEFILLPFVGQDAPKPLRSRVGRDQPVLSDVLHLTAVSRIYLGNWIPNHQPSWVKLGLAGAIEALRWGCNDIGGTLMEEHITSMAGAIGGTGQTVEALRGAIEAAHRPAQERTTLYGIAPGPVISAKLAVG
jgi:5-amino-6-(D-ribitylamino)uracil---L-tyrosine 4-hydroxyphenyl transferase